MPQTPLQFELVIKFGKIKIHYSTMQYAPRPITITIAVRPCIIVRASLRIFETPLLGDRHRYKFCKSFYLLSANTAVAKICKL